MPEEDNGFIMRYVAECVNCGSPLSVKKSAKYDLFGGKCILLTGSCENCFGFKYGKWDGKVLKKKLKERKITMNMLAEHLGVTRQSIDRWIGGRVPKGDYPLFGEG